MRVMGVVCAPWSCGTEKCPFDFGRTCVPEERTEERTKERTWDWRERRVFIAPEGCGALSSPPKDAERGSSAPFGTGRPGGLSLQVRSLSCTMSGERVGGSSRETRSAIEARGDGAADGVLGF